jgi:hypothetical protein
MAPVVAERVSSRRRRAVALGAVALVAATVTVALLAGRDGRDERGTPPRPAGTPPPAVLPLLGTHGRVPARAALAVKVDNTERGRPQSGLAEADIVFEEMVEGGLTRLLVVYHSRDPETVGPVRSARSTDLSILAELGRPLFAWSGANPTFAAAVAAADIIDVGVGAAPEAYRRADDRPAPYNLYAAPDLLRNAGSGDAAAATSPEPLFSYRDAGMQPSGPGVATALGFRTTGNGTLATEFAWSWDAVGEAWVRDQNGAAHVDGSGVRVYATNVVVRFTPYGDSGVRDSAGAVVPEAVAVGEGDAWVLSGGRAQPGRWRKTSADAVTTYTDLAGGPLRLAPGATWVEVVPPASGEIVRQ